MLDLVEEPLDLVAGLVEVGTEADWVLAIALRREVGPRAPLVDERPDPVGVKAAIRHVRHGLLTGHATDMAKPTRMTHCRHQVFRGWPTPFARFRSARSKWNCPALQQMSVCANLGLTRQSGRGQLSMRIFGSILIVIITLMADLPESISADSVKLPRYTATYSTKLEFGRRIEIPYILDSADVDGDGFDDFAVGAKIVPPQGNVLKAPKIYSFLVQNVPSSGEFRSYNLGKDSLTHRTWTGAFLRPVQGQPMHFVLGRNGEIGLPNELVGEPTTIYRIDPTQEKWQIATAFVSSSLNTTASVSVCDIDGDGRLDIYINNVASAMSNGVPPYNKARIYNYLDGNFVSDTATILMRGMQNGDVSVHNFTAFVDIDKDGDCDLLSAYESLVPIMRNGPMVGAMGFPYDQADIDKHQSYVNFNKNGTFQTGIKLLPNPAFGRKTSAFGIGGTKTASGEVIVALTSSYIPSHQQGFSKFALQLFAWRDGQFVEVTKERLVGSVNNREANQSFIRFADVDGNGDEDFYLTRYDNNIVTFLQSNNNFYAKKVNVNGPSGQKAVAFLKSSGKLCMDLADRKSVV